jgi:carbon monoxide dehydrogenase subunit G
MKLEHTIPISAPSEKVNAFLEDIPTVVGCLPHIEDVRELGPDLYEGKARLKIGFVRLQSTGQVRVMRGNEGWRIVGEGRDGRGHSIGHGEVEARVTAVTPGQSSLAIEAEIRLAGVLGALGEAVVRRRAEAILAEFAGNIRVAVEGQ